MIIQFLPIWLNFIAQKQIPMLWMPKMDTLNLKGHRKCGCVAKGWFPVFSDGVFVGFSIDPDESHLFNHNEGRLSEYGEIYFDPPRGRIWEFLAESGVGERGLPCALMRFSWLHQSRSPTTHETHSINIFSAPCLSNCSWMMLNDISFDQQPLV